MTTLGSILSKGYFPRELPPAFQTQDFATSIVTNQAILPAELGPTSSITSKLHSHSVARLGLSRRQMSIPNPVSFLRLCREFVANWPAIDNHCRQSPISRSTPMVNQGNGRELLTISDFPDLLNHKSRVRSTSRYVLKTDIAMFYPSTYTHSIPWALHGKAQAKANRRNLQLPGNALDLCVRNCQDQQTLGIPIGPDTSLALSEVLLSAADIALSNQIPDLNCYRYADDFEFGVQSHGQAEEILGALQEALQLYELTLNFDKTKILDLPLPLDPSWITELRSFTFRSSQRGQRNDIIHYISRAVELAESNPTEFVLKYAVARLRGLTADPGNWDLVEDFLLQCLMVEPGTFLPVLERLMDAHQNNYQIDTSSIDSVMNHQIVLQAPAGRASEVSWSLWALIFWSVPLSKEAADAASKMEDSVVALLALDAESRGLIPTGLNKSLWGSFMTPDDLYDRQWLLSYEANTKGWLPTVGGGDHVAADAAFGFLKAQGVEFYTSSRLLTYQPVPSSGAGIRTPLYSPIQ